MLMTTTPSARVWASGATDRGNRANNEDALLIEPELGLYAVLDGMGGAAAGEVAARLASEALVRFVRQNARKKLSRRELLEYAIDHAGASVHRAGAKDPDRSGMGTTVVACLADPTSLVLGHAGDSRAYLLRHGRLERLTHDHTLAQRLVDDGLMTARDAEQSDFRNTLTLNLGSQELVQADMREMPLCRGDRVLLCSDGLYGCVASEMIQRALEASRPEHDSARMLIELALRGGQASDNVSAIVLGVDP